MPYIPSGWMGDTEAIQADDCWKVNPHAGSTCIQYKYIASGRVGGGLLQNPANDWGEEPGGFDLTGASKLSFWARGEEGGEAVEFKFGILGKGKEYQDSTGSKGKKIKLTKEWKKYELPFDG